VLLAGYGVRAKPCSALDSGMVRSCVHCLSPDFYWLSAGGHPSVRVRFTDRLSTAC